MINVRRYQRSSFCSLRRRLWDSVFICKDTKETRKVACCSEGGGKGRGGKSKKCGFVLYSEHTPLSQEERRVPSTSTLTCFVLRKGFGRSVVRGELCTRTQPFSCHTRNLFHHSRTRVSLLLSKSDRISSHLCDGREKSILSVLMVSNPSGR